MQLPGYSHNIGKNICYLNNELQDYDRLEGKKSEILKELKEAANKFDKEVKNIMDKHGFSERLKF